MGVVHAPGDENRLASLKVLELGHLAALLRHDEAAVRLDAQRGVVRGPGIGKVLVEDGAKVASAALGLFVWLVGLEDHHPDRGGVPGLFGGFIASGFHGVSSGGGGEYSDPGYRVCILSSGYFCLRAYQSFYASGSYANFVLVSSSSLLTVGPYMQTPQ